MISKLRKLRRQGAPHLRTLILFELIKRLSKFQQNPIPKKLLHDADRSLSFAIDPKSAAKLAQSKYKPTSRSSYVPRIDNPPPPLTPPRSQWNAGHWHQHPPQQQYYPQSNLGYH